MHLSKYGIRRMHCVVWFDSHYDGNSIFLPNQIIWLSSLIKIDSFGSQTTHCCVFFPPKRNWFYNILTCHCSFLTLTILLYFLMNAILYHYSPSDLTSSSSSAAALPSCWFIHTADCQTHDSPFTLMCSSDISREAFWWMGRTGKGSCMWVDSQCSPKRADSRSWLVFKWLISNLHWGIQRLQTAASLHGYSSFLDLLVAFCS